MTKKLLWLRVVGYWSRCKDFLCGCSFSIHSFVEQFIRNLWTTSSAAACTGCPSANKISSQRKADATTLKWGFFFKCSSMVWHWRLKNMLWNQLNWQNIFKKFLAKTFQRNIRLMQMECSLFSCVPNAVSKISYRLWNCVVLQPICLFSIHLNPLSINFRMMLKRHQHNSIQCLEII